MSEEAPISREEENALLGLSTDSQSATVTAVGTLSVPATTANDEGDVTLASLMAASIEGQYAAEEEPKTKAVHSIAASQVDRVVTSALPDGMLLSREARIAFQKVATMSFLYLTCLAEEERSLVTKKRATLSGADVRSAVKAAGMDHILPHMHATGKRPRE